MKDPSTLTMEIECMVEDIDRQEKGLKRSMALPLSWNILFLSLLDAVHKCMFLKAYSSK